MDKDKEIKRLNFEDILWIIFIITSLLNVKGNNYQKKYVITNDLFYENEANNIYVIVLFIVLFLYLYFFIRNYSMYQNKGINATKEDYIKVI